MIRRAVYLALAVAITAAAIWYLVTPETARELRTLSQTASWPPLALAICTGALVQWLRAWRFAIMTNGDFALPGLPVVRIAFQLNFLNFALPFRLGELSYPVLMRRAYGQSLIGAAGVLLLARIFDLCTVGAILAAAAAYLELAAPAANTLLWALAAVLAFAPPALVLGTNLFFGWLVDRPLVGEGFQRVLNAAQQSLALRHAQFGAIALSFVIWFVFAVLAWLAANAVTDLPPAVVLLGASAGNLAFALPINGVGGLGASQAAWAVLVNQAGIGWTDAVVSAFAVYAATLAGALLFGGAAMLMPAASPDNSRT